jgi:predicted transcriptional regulator
MKNVTIYSMKDMLKKPSISYIFGRLAVVLGCHRDTVAKYENDVNCEKHFIVKQGNGYALFLSNGS